MTTLTEQKPATGSKKLLGKVALVTGGSRGIGRGIALKLAEEGAIVALTYARSADAAEKVKQEIEQLGTTAYVVKADAESEADVKKLSEDLKKQFGKLDILVNNAGVFDLAPIHEITLEQYDRVFGVNVRGLVATTVAAVPLLNDGGRIINISSVVATHTFPGASVYSATKAAVNTFTRVWAQELGGRGITVNAVSPGTTQSDMFEAAIPAEAHGDIVGKTALGRIGQPRDIANVVAFLASEDGGWVTGQFIEADGGLNM